MCESGRCIVLASRVSEADTTKPARVRFRSLPAGRREDKFEAIATLTLDSGGWVDCPDDWRAPFLPTATGEWATFPKLEDFFVYSGSGVMPGRTWVIAPDADSLRQRWKRLTQETDPRRKEVLFHPHGSHGRLGDRHTNKMLSEGLPDHEHRAMTVASDKGPVVAPVRYGFRSFDRQWIIPDNRLLNRPNPSLWRMHSTKQIYLTALLQHAPTSGPALTFTCLVPDLHHYKGSFGGRAFPLWSDADGKEPNVRPALLRKLTGTYRRAVAAEEILAYLAAIAAHPAYVARFNANLVQPGLRIPVTTSATLFTEAVQLGREVIWLHTFGERFVSPEDGRPASAPRLPPGKGPRISADGAIPSGAAAMPDTILYDQTKNRLWVGTGHVDNVAPEVWAYEVSGKQILTHWFSYRRRDRSRPMIGDRRVPSPLGDIQPSGWLAEYTTELLNVLHVLGRLVALEPDLADLLQRICSGPLVDADKLRMATNSSGPAGGGTRKPINGGGRKSAKDSRQLSMPE
jgi:hypothetical protein